MHSVQTVLCLETTKDNVSIHESTSLEKIDQESMVRFLLADKMRFIFDKF